MAYILLDCGRVPRGNFAFIYDATQNMDLFEKFYDAEKNLKVDYMDFSHKIRVAFEAFALEEEAKKRSSIIDNKDKTITVIKEEIIKEIKTPASVTNYKTIIIDLCVGRELEFSDMLKKYSFIRGNTSDDEIIRRFKSYIRYLYAFGSESSHENISIDPKYLPNKENCLKVAGSFHDFLCVYYGCSSKFDSTMIPIRDYCAVPKTIVEKMGLSLEVGKSLFVKEKDERVTYYIFSSNSDGISKGQRRDIDVIEKLWEDNLVDPSNVIRQTESITGSNGDYKFQVYSLPGKPIKLTCDFLESISLDDKLMIISGLIKGVESIHSYDTPLYHRNINPDAFYIFEIRKKYKPLLAKFDCTKDSSEEAFTVFQNVEKKAKNSNSNHFFAPEVLCSKLGQGVDWEKADIYSLAKTIIYILIGKEVSDSDAFSVLEGLQIDDEFKLLLVEMIDEEPSNRPCLSMVNRFMLA